MVAAVRHARVTLPLSELDSGEETKMALNPNGKTGTKLTYCNNNKVQDKVIMPRCFETSAKNA